MPRNHSSHGVRYEVDKGPTGVAIYKPGDIFGPYLFETYEFVWILQGDVWWEVDGVRHFLPPDSLCLMKPGTVQTFFWDKQTMSRHAFFLFDIVSGRELLPPDSKLPDVLKMKENDICRPLFWHILTLLGQNNAATENTLNAAVHLLMETFISGASEMREDAAIDYPEPILRCFAYARREWKQERWSPLTLSEIARHSGISASQLHRLFVKHLGMGPMKALRMVRLEEASYWLVSTGQTIKEISERAGFSSPYHFSNAFRELYGISPRGFRKRVAEGRAMRPFPQMVQVRRMRRLLEMD